ncbi:MAG: folate hydrolase, partial [Bacteroidota bacterium]|nr:folate hydrolase [Bacteroidota bacterium]
LMTKTDQLRETTAADNALIRSNSYGLAADPTEKSMSPAPKPEVPYLDFSSLQNALSELGKTTEALSQRWKKTMDSQGDHKKINEALYRAEQQLLTQSGLPRRGWYKHTLYAPGFYTGYGVKTIPGVREAIEQRNWKEAQEQIKVVAASIQALTAYLDTIAR